MLILCRIICIWWTEVINRNKEKCSVLFRSLKVHSVGRWYADCIMLHITKTFVVRSRESKTFSMSALFAVFWSHGVDPLVTQTQKSVAFMWHYYRSGGDVNILQFANRIPRANETQLKAIRIDGTRYEVCEL